MPTSIGDVLSALEQLLLEHFKSISSSDATQPFLAFELGTPIPDATFRNPADPTKYSPALALEYLSHRANAVPSIQEHLFVETSNTVDGLYEILLHGSIPVDSASMELLGAIKTTAKSEFEIVLQAMSGISEQFRPTHSDPVDWYDQSVVTNWTPIHIDRADQSASSSEQRRTFSKSLLQWRLAPVGLRPQLHMGASVAPLRSVASLQVAAPAVPPVANQASPGVFRTAGMKQISNAALPRTPVTRVEEFSPAIQASIVRQSESSLSFQRVDMVAKANHSPFLVLQPASPPIPLPPPAPVSSDSFSIHVDVSVVKLRRPWLSDSLLNLTNWFVPSVAKGSFSNGTGASDPGLLPLLPVACILIRNLIVHARWSEEDRNNLENSTHLGAFGLLGRSYDQNSATLKVPGMQSVAWICDPLPVLPPLAAPTM